MHSTENTDQARPDPTADPDNPCPASGTYFCFDFGQKRIGLAVGHSDTKSANPLTVIRNINGRPEWHHIDERVNEWKPTGLVVGLPLPDQENQEQNAPKHAESPENHRQSTGKQQTSGNNQQLLLSAAFSKKLRNRYKIPVYRCDERYSSIEAARLLAENRSRGNRKKVQREDLDKVAAAIILNQWFNNEFE